MRKNSSLSLYPYAQAKRNSKEFTHAQAKRNSKEFPHAQAKHYSKEFPHAQADTLLKNPNKKIITINLHL